MPVFAAQLPDDGWQELLQQTQNRGLERKLDEEARLQLNNSRAQVQAEALRETRQALRLAQQERERIEQEQTQLEDQLQEVQQRLQIRSTSLGEVFAVFREEKANLFNLLSTASYTHQYPELMQFAQPSSADERLPLIKDFSQLWQVLQQSWQASGQVVTYSGQWIDPKGFKQSGLLTRLGDLQLMHEQGVLKLEDERLPTLWAGQPARIVKHNQQFIRGDHNRPSVDPARGLTLEIYSRQPTLLERNHQGGFVGYLIVFLGCVGLLVAAVQAVRLHLEQKRVKYQLANPKQLQADNSLGRVLAGMNTASQQQDYNPESLEASLDELLIRESAALERGLPLVKLLAAIAPLLGLLGTVTGMIATFQAINLFGTGDPSLMAAGISQALVTTVQGLLTAVPLLLAHLLLQGRSRNLARILEAESAAWLANLLNLKPQNAAPNAEQGA